MVSELSPRNQGKEEQKTSVASSFLTVCNLLDPSKAAVDNLDVHLDVHLERDLEVHGQAPTRQSPDCSATTRQSLDCLRTFGPQLNQLKTTLKYLLTIPKLNQRGCRSLSNIKYQNSRTGSEPEPGSQARIVAEPARRNIKKQNLNQVPIPAEPAKRRWTDLSLNQVLCLRPRLNQPKGGGLTRN